MRAVAGRNRCQDCGRMRRTGEFTKSSPKRCRDCRRLRLREKTMELKLICMEHYGRTCACCGESDPVFLCLDHVNDDGADHRREICGRDKDARMGGLRMYQWLIKNNFPPGFQFLCFNCNCAKEYNPGGCPHQQLVGT